MCRRFSRLRGPRLRPGGRWLNEVHGKLFCRARRRQHGDKNVSVRVPPAALARDVQIDVEWKEEIVPVRRGVPSGVVIALRTTPAVEFREAIQIHVRFPPRVRGGTLVGYEIQPDGRLRPLDVLGVNAKEGHATFLTFHALKFTWVYPD